MPCDTRLLQEQVRQAKEDARRKLLAGTAGMKRNPLTRKLELTGITPEEKRGMSDNCILSALAKEAQFNPAVSAAFTRARLTPAEVMREHAAQHAAAHAAGIVHHHH